MPTRAKSFRDRLDPLLGKFFSSSAHTLHNSYVMAEIDQYSCAWIDFTQFFICLLHYKRGTYMD